MLHWFIAGARVAWTSHGSRTRHLRDLFQIAKSGSSSAVIREASRRCGWWRFRRDGPLESAGAREVKFLRTRTARSGRRRTFVRIDGGRGKALNVETLGNREETELAGGGDGDP